jgi:hypothetical protein
LDDESLVTALFNVSDGLFSDPMDIYEETRLDQLYGRRGSLQLHLLIHLLQFRHLIY